MMDSLGDLEQLSDNRKYLSYMPGIDMSLVNDYMMIK